MSNITEFEERIARLERTVAYLMEHLNLVENQGFRPRSTVPPEIIDLIQRGNKLEAIKLYREHTGVGLKEAKDAVEDLARQYRP